jgi:glycerophosphoryl diester phosphodiesterase
MGPENTLEAFSEAYKNGVRYFETDLHATKDGHLFLMHDKNLIRVCGKNIDPESLSLEELGKFLIEDIFKIPTLDELHQLFPDVYLFST